MADQATNSRFRNSLELADLVTLARQAGDAIMAIYQQPASANISLKADDSPVTAADLAAHRIIAAALPQLLDVPLLSEEGEPASFAERRQWARYWLVDPLDGTREFISRNGEFTVNIALIEAGKPVLGVVHLPVQQISYAAINLPAEGHCLVLRYEGDQPAGAICGRSLQVRRQDKQPLVMLASHRHNATALRPLLGVLQARWPGPIEVQHAGSSLKFCRLAEGSADFYPRHGLTSEWDTAASQAILEAAGGALVEASAAHRGEWQPLVYNTGDSLLNPFFYALADKDADWLEVLKDMP